MWDHTSSVMALLANVNSAKGKKFEPDDFHPYTTKSNQGVRTKEEAQALLDQAGEISANYAIPRLDPWSRAWGCHGPCGSLSSACSC